MAKDNNVIDDVKALSDEELDAVTGGASTFYSIDGSVKGKNGDRYVFTYYDENRKMTARTDYRADELSAVVERLRDQGVTRI